LYATPAILPDYRLRVDPGAALADRKSRLTVSLITTVLNEAHNVTAWIGSLPAQQKRLPDEVIITDGGSRDGTFAALQELS
jgi:hypothetical protein